MWSPAAASTGRSGSGRPMAGGRVPPSTGTPVRLWEADGGRALATLHGHVGAVHSVALSGDGGLVASGGLDGTVRLWEADGGRPLATLHGHSGGGGGGGVRG